MEVRRVDEGDTRRVYDLGGRGLGCERLRSKGRRAASREKPPESGESEKQKVVRGSERNFAKTRDYSPRAARLSSSSGCAGDLLARCWRVEVAARRALVGSRERGWRRRPPRALPSRRPRRAAPAGRPRARARVGPRSSPARRARAPFARATPSVLARAARPSRFARTSGRRGGAAAP